MLVGCLMSITPGCWRANLIYSFFISRRDLFCNILLALYSGARNLCARRWPQRIIGWSRLLAGDYGDPLVGRDILIGALFGVVMMLATSLAFLGCAVWPTAATAALSGSD